MAEFDFSDPVAVRVLRLAGGGEVRVTIARPFEPEQYPGEYWCPFSIQGLGKDRVRRVIGLDSMQALMLALKAIGSELYDSPEAKEGRLTWEGDRDLDFPVLPGCEDLLPRPKPDAD